MKSRKPSVLTVVLLSAVAAAALVLPPHCIRAEPPPGATDQDKPDKAKADADLAKALKDADVVFTGLIGKVRPLGHTNSIPASVFGNVTFKDLKALHGALPEAATFSYSYKEGVTENMDLESEARVLVATKQKGVVVIVSATEANLALAKKAVGADADK